jgi:hypothetical protein
LNTVQGRAPFFNFQFSIFNFSTIAGSTSVETHDQPIAAVELHHGAAPRLLMQVVDVLRDQLMHFAARLERGQRAVRVVRPRGLKSRPPAKAARLVKAPHFGTANERVVLNGLVPRPRAARTAIVRNARFRAASGAGEDDESGGGVDEVEEGHGEELRIEK